MLFKYFGCFSWDNIAAIADPVHVKSILLSLKLGFFCTVVCLLLAYPLAMILNSFHRAKAKETKQCVYDTVVGE